MSGSISSVSISLCQVDCPISSREGRAFQTEIQIQKAFHPHRRIKTNQNAWLNLRSDGYLSSHRSDVFEEDLKKLPNCPNTDCIKEVQRVCGFKFCSRWRRALNLHSVKQPAGAKTWGLETASDSSALVENLAPLDLLPCETTEARQSLFNVSFKRYSRASSSRTQKLPNVTLSSFRFWFHVNADLTHQSLPDPKEAPSARACAHIRSTTHLNSNCWRAEFRHFRYRRNNAGLKRAARVRWSSVEVIFKEGLWLFLAKRWSRCQDLASLVRLATNSQPRSLHLEILMCANGLDSPHWQKKEHFLCFPRFPW